MISLTCYYVYGENIVVASKLSNKSTHQFIISYHRFCLNARQIPPIDLWHPSDQKLPLLEKQEDVKIFEIFQWDYA